MKINEIITENIFTCDYHSVMQAVAELYQEHYDINIWNNAEAHDEAAQVLMKEHPTQEELEFIIDTSELPERFMDLNFPLNDELMYNGAGASDDVVEGDLDEDSDLEEEPASRELCQSGKPNSALGASNLASCKSQGLRPRESTRGKGKSHKIGNERTTVKGKKIKGKKYGGPLPDWS
jgi:hypothetical protein